MGHSVGTAIAALLQYLKYASGPGSGLGPLALDINNAYDQVSRPAMDAVLSHLGITSNAFYCLYSSARNKGPVRVMGAPSLAAPFTTSHSIK